VRQPERLEQPAVRVRGRREERGVVLEPRAEPTPEPGLALHGRIREIDEEGRQQQQRSSDAEIAHAPGDPERLAEQEPEQSEEQQADGHEHRAVAGGQHLQRDERRGQSKVATLPLLEVHVRRRQRERNPLHARQRQLTDSEEPGWRALEDHRADDGASRRDAEPPRQDERTEPAQNARRQRDEVRCQNEVSCQPDDGRREEREPDDVLPVGKTEPRRVIDVRVEDRPGPGHERVRVPGEEVVAKGLVRTLREAVLPRVHGDRIGQQHGQRREQAQGQERFEAEEAV
jgi:hypothetical protein